MKKKDLKWIGPAVVLSLVIIIAFFGMQRFAVSESSVVAGNTLTTVYQVGCGGLYDSNYKFTDVGSFCDNSNIEVVYTCAGGRTITVSDSPGSVQHGAWIELMKTFRVPRDFSQGWCDARLTVTADGLTYYQRDYPREFHVTEAAETCRPTSKTCPDGSVVQTGECVNNQFVALDNDCARRCSYSDWECNAWSPCENNRRTRSCQIRSSANCYGTSGQPIQIGSCTVDHDPEDLVDTDGDGLIDKADACPNQPGDPATNGCPEEEVVVSSDRDGDGVKDAEDNCPSIAGSMLNQGCPEATGEDTGGTDYAWSDRDVDGVKDAADRCPDIPGEATNQGCPYGQSGIPGLGYGIIVVVLLIAGVFYFSYKLFKGGKKK